jgi:hypothetical protein
MVRLWWVWQLLGVLADESCEGLLELDDTARGGGSCETTSDCHLNGDCSESACECDVGWTGPHCEKLNLLPAEDPETGCVC